MHRLEVQEKITCLIEQSVKRLVPQEKLKEITEGPLFSAIEIPKDISHGDFTSNTALKLTRVLKKKPMDIAGLIIQNIEAVLKQDRLDGIFSKIEAIKPGFINIWLSDDYLRENLKFILAKGEEYGSNGAKDKKRYLIEFVSANPTGPLTVAHGRQAAIGDALARILKFYGYDVTKEYFNNDDGRQIRVLGQSIMHHYLDIFGIEYEFPEDGYRGGYIRDIADDIKNEYGDKFVNNYQNNLEFFSNYGASYILEIIKKDLQEFDVNFDTWFSQKTLTREKVVSVLDGLRKKGYVFDFDGAVWFKSTDFGDEKDRVVIKSDGALTYFAPDIAYHLDKYQRGFDMLVNLWGPDHHGYIPRLKAAIQALGYGKNTIFILIVQLATLYRNGEAISMSTRKGEFITLKEVMDEVGKDVARFYFLMRKLDSHLDFDIEIAKKESMDNPVYYIQYAHARIWSILEFSGGKSDDLSKIDLDLSRLVEKEEKVLVRLLSQFPVSVRDSALSLEPYFIIVYLNSLAAAFHEFYTKHRVITDDLVLTKSRLFLVDCVRTALANGLGLLGVSFPKKM